MSFEDRLKEARNGSGLTQGQAADALGVHKNSWAKYEQGINFPNVEKLPEMAKLFNRPLWWFFASDEDLTELGMGPVPPLAPDYDPTKPAPELGKPSVRGKGRKEELLRTERKPAEGLAEAASRVKSAQGELNAALAALEALMKG